MKDPVTLRWSHEERAHLNAALASGSRECGDSQRGIEVGRPKPHDSAYLVVAAQRPNRERIWSHGTLRAVFADKRAELSPRATIVPVRSLAPVRETTGQRKWVDSDGLRPSA